MIPIFLVFFRDGLILDMAGIHLDRFLAKEIAVEEKYRFFSFGDAMLIC